ncbi:hypothetical protein, partial [Bradyrhizobium hipponense]|uniref:hypothetical protein n=1 Tax=Bradyrhizobium hipponense TaxID=2605638 RepID=UPI001AEEBC62
VCKESPPAHPISGKLDCLSGQFPDSKSTTWEFFTDDFFTKPRSPNAVPSLQNAGPALISAQYAYCRPAQESRCKTVLDR